MMKKRKATPLYCCEANKNGTVTLYVDGDLDIRANEQNDITIERDDIVRLMHACIDALRRRASRR